jgi:hypothetical protein
MMRSKGNKRAPGRQCAGTWLLGAAAILLLVLVVLRSKPTAMTLDHLNDGENHLKRMLLANAERKIAERRAWLSDKHSEGSKFAALKSEQLY